MDKQIISILKTLYFHENGFYNSEFDRQEYTIPATITQADLALLDSKGLKPNHFEIFHHDTALERLLKFREHKKLTLDFVSSLFLKGITGEMPRARQTLMSYLYIKHLYNHTFEGNDSCEICGLPKVETIDKTRQLYSYYLGHSWNELPLHYLIELEEAITFDKPQITAADQEKLAELIALIAAADKEETAGKLEKRLASAKILKQTDKYKRYGILQTLAECGILPNKFITPKYDAFVSVKDLWKASKSLTGSFRSDIVLPLAGWKGENAVDMKRYNELFNTTK